VSTASPPSRWPRYRSSPLRREIAAAVAPALGLALLTLTSRSSEVICRGPRIGSSVRCGKPEHYPQPIVALPCRHRVRPRWRIAFANRGLPVSLARPAHASWSCGPRSSSRLVRKRVHTRWPDLGELISESGAAERGLACKLAPPGSRRCGCSITLRQIHPDTPSARQAARHFWSARDRFALTREATLRETLQSCAERWSETSCALARIWTV